MLYRPLEREKIMAETILYTTGFIFCVVFGMPVLINVTLKWYKFWIGKIITKEIPFAAKPHDVFNPVE